MTNHFKNKFDKKEDISKIEYSMLVEKYGIKEMNKHMKDNCYIRLKNNNWVCYKK